MNITIKQTCSYLAVASISMLAAACVVVAPLPADKNSQGSQATDSKTAAQGSAVLCNIDGKQQQTLSEGSTKAVITQSCEETSILIQNNHAEDPKRCKVSIGSKTSEIYLQPGESRSLTQAGPTARNAVQVKCVNDTNRPR